MWIVHNTVHPKNQAYILFYFIIIIILFHFINSFICLFIIDLFIYLFIGKESLDFAHFFSIPSWVLYDNHCAIIIQLAQWKGRNSLVI